MKRKLLTATMVLTLLVGSCGKSDDNSSDTSDNKAPIKKIKEVNISYIESKYDRYLDVLTYPYFDEKLENVYTLKSGKVAYQYDEAGKITKVVESYSGREDRVKDFSYGENKMIFTLKNDEGKVVSHEIPLDKNGNVKDERIVFDNQAQLIRYRDEKISWEGGNLIKVERENQYEEKKQVIECHLSYYADKPNKNNFRIWRVEGDVALNYGLYFDTDVPFPLGVPTKNLVKSLSFTIDKEENSDFNYSYTYDSDGYVTTIAEQTYIKDNNTQTTILTNDQYNWADLHDFIERIQSGTEKNFSYKLISDTNGKYVFEILQLIKVTKDTNGKPIDLTVEKVYHHTIHYTENNGVRTNQNLELKIMLNERKTASYQITY